MHTNSNVSSQILFMPFMHLIVLYIFEQSVFCSSNGCGSFIIIFLRQQ